MTHSYFLRIHWKQFYICELHDTTEQYASAFSGRQNLPLPVCWSSEQSSIHPVPFPRSTQHQFPHPQAPGTLLSAPFHLPGPPQPQPLPHHSVTGLLPLFKMAKGRVMDPTCSELLYLLLVCASEADPPLPPIFAIVLLGSPTSVSTENICHSKTVIFKTLTFTSSSGTLTSDKN